MRTYRADLHIHTVLSPCASLNMSPENIVANAQENKLDFIAITDHNDTRNCEAVMKAATGKNMVVLAGCEANTAEEVHVLALFPDIPKMKEFQSFINQHLPAIKNHPEILGDQVIVDEHANIKGYEEKYLGAALTASITEVEQKTHELDGIFIPAHVDRPKNSIFSQLGFIPEGLRFEALQISKKANEKTLRQKYSINQSTNIVRFSDAHYPENIGEAYTFFKMKKISFSEIKKALLKIDNRTTTIS